MDYFNMLSDEDKRTAFNILCARPFLDRAPDFVISPDGREPYLFRWHVIPRNKEANVYFHMQVRSDPERPLHDHPWDNTSVILSGGYDELTDAGFGPNCIPYPAMRKLRKGDVCHRVAEEAHRLLLPADFTYTLTLFSTGPVRREWGFYFPNRWRSSKEVIVDTPEGVSVFKGR